jgi:hypothetical protein
MTQELMNGELTIKDNAGIRVVILLTLLLFMVCSCTSEPAEWTTNRKDYEKLALIVAEDLQPGDIRGRDEAAGELRRLMMKLDVYRVRYDQFEKHVVLSGRSNIITGCFSYLYYLGDGNNSPEELQTDGLKRRHLDGRWYVQQEYWD